MPTVVVPLARGFEETEAVTIIDVLRRADIDVVVAGVDPDSDASGALWAMGAHDIAVRVDRPIGWIKTKDLQALVLPGGMPGTVNLLRNDDLRHLVLKAHKKGKLLGAICAAPTVFNAAGILLGVKATSHPAHASEMDECDYQTAPVVSDGQFITSRGVGTAIPFALALVSRLVDQNTADDLAARMVVPKPA